MKSGNGGAYKAALKTLAGIIGPRVGLSAGTLNQAWSAGTRDGMTAMLSALGQLGVAYVFNTATPGTSFDCSGLASWAWGQAGVTLPHQSLLIIQKTTVTDLAHVAPGDLLYYPGHVMVALGVGDAIVHAADSRHGVIVGALNGGHASTLQVGDPTPAT